MITNSRSEGCFVVTRPRKPPGAGTSAEPSRTWREQVVIDFLHLLTDRSVALLATSAAGVVPANPRGELRLAAASSEEAGLLELFRLRNEGKLARAGEQLPLPRRWV